MKYTALIKAIQSATSQLQGRVATVANQALVLRNWLVGAYLIEFEQHGKERAKYGERLLERVAEDLESKGVRGLKMSNLERCRLLFRFYPQLAEAIPYALPTESTLQIPYALPTESETLKKRPSPAPNSPNPAALSAAAAIKLSWSHFQELVRLNDPWQRAFYEIQCLAGNWSTRQLQRQIGSLLYERTGLSTDKPKVVARAQRQDTQQTFADLIRDPYVLEFAGLAERPEYLESDLESALLNHLQSFLLELGAGFCFEARQKRITVGRNHDYIDLVFYHRRLRCHVLIDLKIRPFKHADAGQMNFYLNWWKTHGMEAGDTPPVGLLLCSDRDQSAVEYATAGLDQKLFVSRYLVALPSVEKLKAFLDADRDRIESLMLPSPAKKAPKRPKA